MPARQRKFRPLVVVKRGRHPALFVVAARANRFSFVAGKLSTVRLRVARFTSLCCAFELDFLLLRQRLMAGAASNGPVRP